MELLTLISFSALPGLGLAFLTFIYYRMKSPELLPANKPKFKFLPKYKIMVPMSQSVLEASNSVQLLTDFVERAEFKVFEITSDKIVYSRGKWLGDFHIKHMKLNLEFSLPLQKSSELKVEYGAFALFDTGGLWLFSSDFFSQLEEAV